MKCKCGAEIDHPFKPDHQAWDYSHGEPRLTYELCEHGVVTVGQKPKPAEPEPRSKKK